MAKKQKVQEDDLAELVFPTSGVELTRPSLMGRPDSTPLAENVRVFDPFKNRARGGSRPGIDKIVDERHSGVHEIQHITTIVTVSGEMVGWDFDVPADEFEGPHFGLELINVDLGVPFLFLEEDTNIPIGPDTGYPPSKTDVHRTLRLEITDAETITNDGFRAVQPINVDATITMTLRDGAGEAIAFESVALHTDPAGEVGDDDRETTTFDLSDPPDGTAEFTVSSSVAQTIVYSGTIESILGHRQKGRNAVRIRYYDPLNPGGTDNPPRATGQLIRLSATLSATKLGGAAATSAQSSDFTLYEIYQQTIGLCDLSLSGGFPGSDGGSWSVSIVNTVLTIAVTYGTSITTTFGGFPVVGGNYLLSGSNTYNNTFNGSIVDTSGGYRVEQIANLGTITAQGSQITLRGRSDLWLGGLISDQILIVKLELI